MYVLEGSTLGGQVICQILMRNLAVPELPKALSFFNGYGADTQSYWDTFVHYLQDIMATKRSSKECWPLPSLLLNTSGCGLSNNRK